MSLVHGRSPEGESTSNTNPIIIGAKDPSNKAVALKATNGLLEVLPKPTGDAIVAAGKKTDAGTADRQISTAGFNHISVINDGPAELRLAVDESSATGSKIIYVADSEGFDADLAGMVLHYSSINDFCIFRYILS
ncbi:MAG: hypothetical protein PHE82_01290 [Syntrophomonadaceae bacterium]|nr:hypothetical protein [Syntrophomonadaceae bacterium]